MKQIKTTCNELYNVTLTAFYRYVEEDAPAAPFIAAARAFYAAVVVERPRRFRALLESEQNAPALLDRFIKAAPELEGDDDPPGVWALWDAIRARVGAFDRAEIARNTPPRYSIDELIALGVPRAQIAKIYGFYTQTGAPDVDAVENRQQWTPAPLVEEEDDEGAVNLARLAVDALRKIQEENARGNEPAQVWSDDGASVEGSNAAPTFEDNNNGAAGDPVRASVTTPAASTDRSPRAVPHVEAGSVRSALITAARGHSLSDGDAGPAGSASDDDGAKIAREILDGVPVRQIAARHNITAEEVRARAASLSVRASTSAGELPPRLVKAIEARKGDLESGRATYREIAAGLTSHERRIDEIDVRRVIERARAQESAPAYMKQGTPAGALEEPARACMESQAGTPAPVSASAPAPWEDIAEGAQEPARIDTTSQEGTQEPAPETGSKPTKKAQKSGKKSKK